MATKTKPAPDPEPTPPHVHDFKPLRTKDGQPKIATDGTNHRCQCGAKAWRNL